MCVRIRMFVRMCMVMLIRACDQEERSVCSAHVAKGVHAALCSVLTVREGLHACSEQLHVHVRIHTLFMGIPCQ